MFEKEINGCKFQWCDKCDPPCWSTTHNSGTHVGKVNAKENPDVQINYTLVPNPSIWLAETVRPRQRSKFGRPKSTSGKFCSKGRRLNKRVKGQKKVIKLVPLNKSVKALTTLTKGVPSHEGKASNVSTAELPCKLKDKILLCEGGSEKKMIKLTEEKQSGFHEHLPSLLELLGGCVIATLMNPTVLH